MTTPRELALIYIAGPYRGPTPWDVEQHIRAAERRALDVWSLGLVAVCPHTMNRYFNGAFPDALALRGMLLLLSRCDALLTVEGWERSTGAQAEVAYAHQYHLPVFHTVRELAAWTPTRAGRPRP